MIITCKFCKKAKVVPGKREQKSVGLCSDWACLFKVFDLLDEADILDSFIPATQNQANALAAFKDLKKRINAFADSALDPAAILKNPEGK